MRPAQWFRLIHISAVLVRYRLDEIADAAFWLKPVKLIRVLMPWGRKNVRGLPRGARIRLALQDLGPIFVKFGQVLSTRRDLLPADIADELALLQDKVAPFPGAQAQAQVEASLGQPVSELFASFDVTPLASASIAQVHKAVLHDGKEVVAKVLRPGIERDIRRDIDLMMAAAAMLQRYWEGGKQVRPTELVHELEKTVFDELDLEREAANASQLRRNFEGSTDLYVPEVYWPYCKEGVLVLEFVSGIPIGDMAALRDANVNFRSLAERGIKLFYTQVFRDNFFHADMHPGNILVNAENPDEPTLIALDFGIVGSLPSEHQYYLGENFLALFAQDYRRVAQLHVDAGWVPEDTRVDELEGAVRAVCEPHFARSLSQISFGEVLLRLFEVARRFNLIVQPQLVLLQKTLLNIEGLGRELDPDLDIWATARPILTEIMRERSGLDAAARDLRARLPSWLEKTPEMPGLVHEFLSQATRGQLKVGLKTSAADRLEETLARGQRQTAAATLAAGLWITVPLTMGYEHGAPMVWHLPLTTWAGLLGAIWMTYRSIR